MSKVHIYEILAQNEDLGKDAERINSLFSEIKLIANLDQTYTILDFVGKFCFSKWKGRGHCIDIDDFMDTLYYDVLLFGAQNNNFEDFFLLTEIIYSFWMLAARELEQSDSGLRCISEFELLHSIMDEDLSHFNHKAIYDEEKDQILVIEDKPEVTAVVETVEPNLAKDLLHYNHYSLKGDIGEKKSILLRVGSVFEGKREEFSLINDSLINDIFFVLNNFNLRHNNCDPSDQSHYKEYVALMSNDELEGLYDELYEMMLLLFMEQSQCERHVPLEELKNIIKGGQN